MLFLSTFLQWVYILTIVHEVMYFCGISEVDPGVTAEVAIRLALVLENNATNEMDKATGKSIYTLIQ